MLNEVFDDYNNTKNIDNDKLLQLQSFFPDKDIEVLKGFPNA